MLRYYWPMKIDDDDDWRWWIWRWLAVVAIKKPNRVKLVPLGESEPPNLQLLAHRPSDIFIWGKHYYLSSIIIIYYPLSFIWGKNCKHPSIRYVHMRKTLLCNRFMIEQLSWKCQNKILSVCVSFAKKKYISHWCFIRV